jgi:RHS repeat-associated protein
MRFFSSLPYPSSNKAAHYLYAGGSRVKKLVRDQQGNTEVTLYIDGVYEHRYRKNSAGTLTAEQTQLHVMDGRSRIATVRVGNAMDDPGPAVKYNLEDHLGTSTTRLDASGTLIDREEYYPFGDSSLRTFDKKRYRYVGKEKDSESGLYYYGARYYAAWTCRFVSVDPLAGKYPMLSPYNYASNSPIGQLDVDGMQNPEQATAPKGGGGTIQVPDALSVGMMPDTTGLKPTFSTPQEPDEPKALSPYHELSGNLKETMVRFLGEATRVSENSLRTTIWHDQDAWKGSLPKAAISHFALSGHGAVTLGKEVIVRHDVATNYTGSQWISLALHEQIHRQQYEEHGTSQFLGGYVVSALKLGYGNDPAEKEAYGQGDAVAKWLGGHSDLVGLLSKDWMDLSTSQRDRVLDLGRAFRYEVGIDTEIAYLTEWATIGVSQVEGFVDANPNPDEATKAEIIQARSLIQAYRDRITDLHLEKENLRLTLGRP